MAIPAVLLPLLERYAFEFQRGVGPATWVVDVFLDLQVPFDILVAVLEGMFYNDEVPFKGRNRRHIASDMLHLISRWFAESTQYGTSPFGSDETALAISQTLQVLQQNGLDERQAQECQILRVRIEQFLR